MDIRIRSIFGIVCGLAIAALLIPSAVTAQRGGGGGRARGGGAGQVNTQAARTSIRSDSDINRNVNANTNVNRNINSNINVDRDVNVNRDINVGYDYDRWGHPIARGVAAGVAVGTAVALLPSGCSTVVVNGMEYSQCGSTWYQPYHGGTSVQYVVVNPPQ